MKTNTYIYMVHKLMLAPTHSCASKPIITALPYPAIIHSNYRAGHTLNNYYPLMNDFFMHLYEQMHLMMAFIAIKY